MCCRIALYNAIAYFCLLLWILLLINSTNFRFGLLLISNAFTIDDTDSTVLLAFGDSDTETLGFVFDLPTSFPSELGDEAIGTYSVDELSYGAISGLVGSIELNISSYENDVMSGTFSMTGIKTSEDAAARDSVIVTNGIFENIPTLGL